jgi:hypothetical protein
LKSESPFRRTDKEDVMNITIEKQTKIADLQKAFSAAYPFLKLELALPYKATATSAALSSQSLLRVLSANNLEWNEIKLDGNITIAEFESHLLEQWQLPVQILRRSGSVWISTTLTKDWTLEHQNKEGELFSKEHII